MPAHTHKHTHTLSGDLDLLCPQGAWGGDEQEEDLSAGEVRDGQTTKPSSTAAAGHSPSSPGQCAGRRSCRHNLRAD